MENSIKYVLKKRIGILVVLMLLVVGVLSQVNGTIYGDSYIGESAAKSAAYTHANVVESDVVFVKAKLDWDDGQAIYDVDFYTKNMKYEYEIDGLTGKILEHENKTKYRGQNYNKKQQYYIKADECIGESSAKSIAYNHAAVAESDVVVSKVKLDREDGIWVYEIDFYVNGAKYEYEVNASTGDILKYEQKNSDKNSTVNPTGDYITEGRAKEVALNHAGVSEANIYQYECKLDYENGYMVYEIEFKSGGLEYEYEIEATTGNIVKWKSERD